MEIGAKVEDNKIIVVDGNSDEIITIKANEHIKLYIDDKLCEPEKDYEVTSKHKIEYECDTIQGKREAIVTISDDKMQAYLKIMYTPEIKYKLKEKEFFLNLALVVEEEYSKEVEHFTVDEIREVLKKNNIKYGVFEDKLECINSVYNQEILIAEGVQPIQNIPSDVKLFFSPTQMVFPSDDSDEKIDYKNLFRISNVNAGDKIAEIIPEVQGKDGMNVLGQVVKRDYIRSLPINATNGCKIENNNVIATINGKAHITNRNIMVNPVYSVEQVNMETCNIKFVGDIEVYDSVDDNMSVKSGGSLDVSKNINTSNVVSGGEITIVGNAINSKILSGQVDIRKKEYCDVLREFKTIILEIIDVINIVYTKTNKINFNELLISIIETKFSKFQKICLRIVSLNIKNKIKHNKLTDYIKDNLLGYNILNINSMNALQRLLNILQNEIEFYDKNIIVPLDIKLSYCQDCEIKSTGNIIFSGQGQYTSNLIAMKDILFTRKNSVSRGGTLSAGGNISAGIIGSDAEITTKLSVPQDGTITAVYAHKNTVFKVGNFVKVLDYDLENITVSYDDKLNCINILHSSL